MIILSQEIRVVTPLCHRHDVQQLVQKERGPTVRVPSPSSPPPPLKQHRRVGQNGSTRKSHKQKTRTRKQKTKKYQDASGVSLPAVKHTAPCTRNEITFREIVQASAPLRKPLGPGHWLERPAIFIISTGHHRNARFQLHVFHPLLRELSIQPKTSLSHKQPQEPRIENATTWQAQRTISYCRSDESHFVLTTTAPSQASTTATTVVTRAPISIVRLVVDCCSTRFSRGTPNQRHDHG